MNNNIKIAMCTFYAGTEYKKKMDIGIQSKIKYCKQHNIDFILEDETADYFDDKRRYDWHKLLLLKKHISNYDYLFWSDADVLIKNFNFSLIDYINNSNKNNIFIFTYCPSFFINAGNYFVKNTSDTIYILDLIYNQTQFLNGNCCEQNATVYVLQNYPDIFKKTYIEKNSRLFNAYSIYNWSKIYEPLYYKKNDFLIHYAGINTENTYKCMLVDNQNNILTRDLYKDFHPNLPLFYYNNLPLINKSKIYNLYINNLDTILQYTNSKYSKYFKIQQYTNDSIIYNNILNLYWISTLDNNRWNNISYIGYNDFITIMLLLYEKKNNNNIEFTFFNINNQNNNQNNNYITNIFNKLQFNQNYLSNYQNFLNTQGIIYINFITEDTDNYIQYILNISDKLLIPQGIIIINNNNKFISKYINMYINIFNYKELNILQPTNYIIIQKYYK